MPVMDELPVAPACDIWLVGEQPKESSGRMKRPRVLEPDVRPEPAPLPVLGLLASLGSHGIQRDVLTDVAQMLPSNAFVRGSAWFLISKPLVEGLSTVTSTGGFPVMTFPRMMFP